MWVTGVLNGLSLLIILYLVRKDENSAYKVGWIALDVYKRQQPECCAFRPLLCRVGSGRPLDTAPERT